MLQQKQGELETFINSVSELKSFLDVIKNKLSLPEDSTVLDIKAAVLSQFSDYSFATLELTRAESSLRFFKEEMPKLRAELLGNQLNLNVAEFTLFELLSGIDNMLEISATFDSAESAKEFLVVSLREIRNIDIAKKQKSVEKLHEEIALLKSKLQDKLEHYHILKNMVGEIICDLEESSFDLSLDRCKNGLDKLKEDATIFRMLVEQNYIKIESVGDEMRLVSNSNFNLKYDKQ